MKIQIELLHGLRRLAPSAGLPARVVGDSMAPVLSHHDEVRLMPARVYWPGDLIAYLDPSGQLVLHRVIGYWPARARATSRRRFHYLSQGDARPTPDAPVTPDRVLGRVRPRSVSREVSLRQRILATRRFLHFAWETALGKSCLRERFSP